MTNNYALDPNYRLAYVQIWNLDIQRQFPGNVQLNVGYNGAKGTRLDTERALVPSCAATDSCEASSNEAAAPFIYESSEGNSILHAGSVRVRKRMAKGLGISASYVFSKSIDDASSIGGGGVVVVQNPFDLPGDRGLSSFDQAQKFTGNWIYDLPFGDGRRFRDDRTHVARDGQVAVEWQLHDWIGTVFHAAGVGGIGGHQPRRQRIAASERGGWPADGNIESYDRRVVQYGGVLRAGTWMRRRNARMEMRDAISFWGLRNSHSTCR